MFKSVANFSFENKDKIILSLKKILKNHYLQKGVLGQNTFLHTTNIVFEEKSATIIIRFSNSFYIFYVISSIAIVLLPFQSPLIGSSALALFIIFSMVMYFSLDYKLKTILDTL